MKDELLAELSEIRRRECEEAATPSMRWVLARLPGRVADTPGRIDLDAAAIGRGCPEYLYSGLRMLCLHGASGPGMLRVLRVLVELEEARERGEIDERPELREVAP